MQETKEKLPRFLKTLLILSFIGSSFSMFSGLQDALSSPSLERIESFKQIFADVKIDSPESGEMIAEMNTYMENLNFNIINYGASRFMLYAISLIGVYMMYRRRRIGFSIYSAAQSLLLGLPILFGGYSSFSLSLTFIFGFFTLLFISLYASQLNKFNP